MVMCDCIAKRRHGFRYTSVFSVVVAAVAVTIAYASAKGEASASEADAMNQLDVKLHLPGSILRREQPVPASIVLTNRGKHDLFVPLMEGGAAWMFFEILVLGDEGAVGLTNHADGWNDPLDYKVSMIRLAPGASHTISPYNVGSSRLSGGANSLSELIANTTNRSFELVAIYRDHAWAHDADDEVPKDQLNQIWKGPAMSSPVRVTIGEQADDDAKERESSKEDRDTNQLSIQLRLSRKEIAATEPLNAEILFGNPGKKAVYFPIADGQEALAFVDFILFQTVGGESRLADHEERWNEKFEGRVKVVRLEAGGTYRILLRPAILLRGHFNPLFLPDNSSFDIIAIYRDHSWAHTAVNDIPDKDERLVWKGTVLSSAMHLRIGDRREK